MLQELRIRNLAVIDEADLEFTSGLNIISGETGAGKSMIIDALEIVLGARTSPDLIRGDAEQAEVEALFDLQGKKDVAQQLKDQGLEGDGDEFMVRRIFSRSGKNKTFINGHLATTSILNSIVSGLVEFSSQEERSKLLMGGYQLLLLDRVSESEKICEEFSEKYQRYQSLKEELERKRGEQEQIKREREIFESDLKELEETRLCEGEEEKLRSEKTQLSHASKIQELVMHIEVSLYSGEGGTSTVLDILGALASEGEELSKLSPDFKEEALLLQSLRVHIEEIIFSLRKKAKGIEEDPQRLQEIEERLHLIGRLQRKHGVNFSDLLKRTNALRSSLLLFQESEEEIKIIEKEMTALVSEIISLAEKLSAMRKRGASTLQKKAAPEFPALGMKNAKFVASLKPIGESEGVMIGGVPLSLSGKEQVELLFSANVGEKAKPLAKVASGGERSRILLILKALAGSQGDIAVYVFDEVDVGLGGSVVEAVGRKLSLLARKNQVICITHWPQIAVFAETHFVVHKRTVGNVTKAAVQKLDEIKMVQEIARMLGGSQITETTRLHAAEMRRQAHMRI